MAAPRTPEVPVLNTRTGEADPHGLTPTRESVPLSSLRPHARNYRGHPERQVEVLRTRVRRYGVYRPVVVAADYTILAGHGLVAALRLEGFERVEVKRYDVEPGSPEALDLMVGDNEGARLADDDRSGLADLLDHLASTDAGLAGTGYDGDDLDALLADLGRAGGDGWAGALAGLPDGDKPPFEQMTFTLHTEQAERVRAALEAAKEAGDGFPGSPNENSNGNALAALATVYLDAVG